MTLMAAPRKWWAWPLYVPLLAMYPPIFIAAANPGQVQSADVGAAVAIAAACSLVLLAVTRSVTGSLVRAGLVSASVICMFFAYGPLHGQIEMHLVQRLEHGDQTVADNLTYLGAGLSAVWLALTALVAWACSRVSADKVRRLTSAGNLVVALLVAFALIQFVTRSESLDGDPARAEMATNIPQEAGPVADARDIYYIILDGYARADILQRHYAFSNDAFLHGLRDRGFQVAESSQSNYFWTFLSLASSLNLDYLQSLVQPPLNPQSTDRTVLYELIRNNEAARFLRSRGYRYVHLQSTWGATARNDYADEFVTCHSGLFDNEFYRAIAEGSWLRVLGSQASSDLAQCHLSNIEFLRTAGALPGPKFVFAHFLPPHHPYLFDQDGNVLRNANITNQFEFQKRLWGRKDLYLGQTLFMNRKVLEVVDGLLSTSKQTPIVIIQSDHGPQLPAGADSRERSSARFANLTAVLLPAAPAGLLRHDIAAVNVFRTVFSFYFGAGLEELPVRRYLSGFDRPYEFVEFEPEARSR